MNGEFTVAVHSLVFLDHKRRAAHSDEIAKNVCTHPARVRKVLSKLKKAGLIASREGQGTSGYAFLGSAEEITLLQVLDALGARVVQQGWRSGDMDMECLIASGMGEIMDGLCRELDDCCRERLRQLTLAQIERRVFGAPPGEGENA